MSLKDREANMLAELQAAAARANAELGVDSPGETERAAQALTKHLAGLLAKCPPVDVRYSVLGLLAEAERLGAGGEAWDAMLLELCTDIRQRAAVGRWPGSGGRRWGH